jgi:hypothetical protein
MVRTPSYFPVKKSARNSLILRAAHIRSLTK